MVLKKKKVVLTAEESKNIKELFDELYDADSLLAAAEKVSPNEGISTSYFKDIFDKYTPAELRPVKKLVLDKKICSTKERKKINCIFKTINTINRWANYPEDMVKHEYLPRIRLNVAFALYFFIECIVLFVLRTPENAQNLLKLFDLNAILAIVYFIDSAWNYWNYRNKLNRLSNI